ncbi:uncharacterized protein L203_103748 [Cryptococcus depauperatus CBS 7841]|uniref:Uncharacterized protein n=1 Tax=Cryptococcus depauperatus CBS 7841 TaxID=1295531 RepID=A0A1E3IEF6_9TREE|nr:hypothetical protein L203_03754 [Cryptococcus depauperatus CBS 7841]
MVSHIPTASTAPGPPVSSSPGSMPLSVINENPYNVDLVLPYDISIGKAERDRQLAEQSIKDGYEELLRALEASGFRVASRGGRGARGNEQVWVFVGASEQKVEQLIKEERHLDTLHHLPTLSMAQPPAPATRLRLIYNVLTAPTIQGGLGITPGRGKWARVKSIAALHDEVADKAWVEKWTMGGDWKVGLTKDLAQYTQKGGLGDQQPPPIHLYFEFLTTYTLSLMPLSVISVLFYLFAPKDSYPPLYAFLLSVYSSVFIAIWRIKQRKFAVRFGTTGCESIAVGRLRPEYVSSLGLDKSPSSYTNAIDIVRAGNELTRDTKVAVSIPIIVICGIGLGMILMGLFMLEAFVAQVYDGFGKEIVPLIPTGLFALVIPQIVGVYRLLAKSLVKWENHPTPVSEEKSLTTKAFAMNAIVAYLGLYLSAYVYIPFGNIIMGHVQTRLAPQVPVAEHTVGSINVSAVNKQVINGGRLKSQLFAYTVTNQIVNVFLELGLPYVLRFIGEWRAGKTTLKSALKGIASSSGGEKTPDSETEVEKRFLNKVERELALPEYSTFDDYAEMVTQFGYVVIWSIVWPLAPIFALINNYVELRSDSLKICKHVRRPVGDRVETIGPWLETLDIIAWIGAVTNATLIYLFRPSPPSPHPSNQSSNPNFPLPGSFALSHIVSSFRVSPTIMVWSSNLIPLALIALSASHGYIMLRWVVEGAAERIWWKGSWEENEIQRIRAGSNSGDMAADSIDEVRESVDSKVAAKELVHPFWNGGEEGAREIARTVKAQ